MHNDTAGTATFNPIMSFVEISHQTGARLRRFPFHTIELTKKTRDPVNDQAIYNKVPTLRALQCHGRGSTTRNMEIGATTWKATFVAVMMKGGRFGCR